MILRILHGLENVTVGAVDEFDGKRGVVECAKPLWTIYTHKELSVLAPKNMQLIFWFLFPSHVLVT
jgi:hypothetical protein